MDNFNYKIQKDPRYMGVPDQTGHVLRVQSPEVLENPAGIRIYILGKQVLIDRSTR